MKIMGRKVIKLSTKRERAENWSEEERTLLTNLVKERWDIIENRYTDTATNMLKLQTWKQIWEKFVSMNNRPRTMQKLRDQWKRMKVSSRSARKKSIQVADQVVINPSSSQDMNIDPENNSLATLENGTSQSLKQAENKSTKDISLQSPEKDPGSNSINSYTTLENGMSQRLRQTEYKSTKESSSPDKSKIHTAKVYQTKNGIDYKKSIFELNKLMKEQIMNCTFEEHQLRIKQMREEHDWKMRKEREAHVLHCENERLRAELLRLDIDLRKKQLNGYVI